MAKASETELSTLHGEIARKLTEVISDGVEVGTKEGTVKVTAPAAYFMAGITMLKLNNITADPETNAELSDLSKALANRRKTAKDRMTSQEIVAAAADLDPAGFSPEFMQ